MDHGSAAPRLDVTAPARCFGTRPTATGSGSFDRAAGTEAILGSGIDDLVRESRSALPAGDLP